MGEVMRLARLLILSACGMGIAAVVCANPTEGRYMDVEHRFSLQPPLGWSVNKQLIPHYAVLVEPTARPGDEAATIGTYGEPVHVMTLEAYVKATRAEIAKQKGLTVYGEKKLTLGGEPAYSWRMHVNIPGQAAHENRQVVCLRGPQALTLTLTTLPAAMRKYDAAFDKVVTSFRWGTRRCCNARTVGCHRQTQKERGSAANKYAERFVKEANTETEISFNS